MQCDTSQEEDDIFPASSSQRTNITVQNPRGGTTVVINIGGNEYISPNISPDDSIENELAMKLSIESDIDNFASVEKNRRIILS